MPSPSAYSARRLLLVPVAWYVETFALQSPAKIGKKYSIGRFSMNDRLLEVNGLVKRYDGRAVVNELCFFVRRGEIVGHGIPAYAESGYLYQYH